MTPALLHPDLLRQFPGGIAFVDIETNGGPAQRASITEIGIVQVDEDGVREWSALLQPASRIPHREVTLQRVDQTPIDGIGLAACGHAAAAPRY